MVGVAAALLLLVLLIVFMLENSTKVEVHFLGVTGTVPLGMALLIAAVGGGVVVGIAGVARVTQLRMGARRTRRGTSRACRDLRRVCDGARLGAVEAVTAYAARTGRQDLGGTHFECWGRAHVRG